MKYVCPVMHYVVWRRELKPGNSVECSWWGISKRHIKDQRSTRGQSSLEMPHGYNSWLVEKPKRLPEITLRSTGVKLLIRNAFELLNSVRKNSWPLKFFKICFITVIIMDISNVYLFLFLIKNASFWFSSCLFDVSWPS